MSSLILTGVQKRYGRVTAVDSFNLQVASGEFISFLGPSGCGKTTTLRMIAGFETPSAGQILVNGEDVTHKRPNQRQIGMVFQSYALFPNMTAADNIGFGLKVAGRSRAEIKERVAEMLALVKMSELGNRYPYQLSGGQQQRVALARALAVQPQLLLLDEPLSALDAKIRLSLRTEIRAIQQQLGITTIYVTHDQEEALSLSDRVVVMNESRMEQVGTPFEIYNFPQTLFVASFVGTLNIVPGQAVQAGTDRVLLDGQEIRAARPLPAATTHTAVSLALRPELLSLHENGVVGNRLHGRVETISFLGSIVRIQVRLQQNSLFLDEFNNPHLALPAIGEDVTIHFQPEACLVLS
jgi:putative spermidine/putrescine transport system ATP-binding protein